MSKYNLVSVLCLIWSIVIVISCKTKFNTVKSDYKANKSSEAFERGKILVYSICGGCHYDPSAQKFIGTPIHEVPGFIGKVYAANLTNSKSHGIPPHYSDAELKYLLKTGIAKDGRFVPYMLRPNMADEDLNDIIVYLRSDAPAISAADTTIGVTHFTLVCKMAINIMAKPLPYNTDIKKPPDRHS